jgi:glycosyltransferase involved in cell wall biosynthesis
VAFLTNLIPPYHKPLFLLLSKHFSEFRLFISTPMEANRPWLPEWAGLDVVVQKGFTLRQRWKHPRFGEAVAVHFPTDTIRQLSGFQPDAVISVEMGFRTLLACCYAKLHPSCRVLVWSEVTEVTERGRGGLRMLLRRFLARRVDGFLAVGSAGVRYIESLRVARSKIFQIAYSTNLEPFIALALTRPAAVSRRLLFSGQLVERKGLIPFVKALTAWAALHPDRQTEFVLVGDGPLRAVLSSLPLPDNVKLLFIGTLQYHQLPLVYAECGIFVLPTLADTWGVVVNEALASGLPVLGSVYSQAVEEMVCDGENGWTFSPDQPDEMENALNRALTAADSELNTMRVCARARALEVTPENAAAVCSAALS